MYEEIEKQYIKNNPDVKFSRFYWIVSIILCPIYLIIIKCFKLSSVAVSNYIVLPISILTIIVYLLVGILKNTDKTKKEEKHKIRKYFKNLESEQQNSLIEVLKKYNINNTEKLKLVITYYNNKFLVKKTKQTPFLISILITFILTKILDYSFKNFNDIKIYIFLFFIIYICYYIIVNSVKPKNSTENLIDDLSQLYMNFEKYESILNND